MLCRSLDEASNAMADKKETSGKEEEIQRRGNIYISYLNDPTVPASKADFVDECSALDPALSELTPLTSISEMKLLNGSSGVLELGVSPPSSQMPPAPPATAKVPTAVTTTAEPVSSVVGDLVNSESVDDLMEDPVSVITEEVSHP